MSLKTTAPHVKFLHFIIPPDEWAKKRKGGARPWSERLTPVLVSGWEEACKRLDIDPNIEEFIEHLTENYIGVVLRRETDGGEIKDVIEMVLLYQIDSYVGSHDVDLVIKLAVGSTKNMDKWYDQVDEMARDIGCTMIRMDGRFGWSRLLPNIGYTERARIFTKRISPCKGPSA